ncbi:MAG: hypothetical protein GPOALKHO_001815 [Sodalis sp.]|nr:MAG: hypothetical protein GPOALKHO_001815 [Sodalis sp.]
MNQPRHWTLKLKGVLDTMIELAEDGMIMLFVPWPTGSRSCLLAARR